MDKQHIAKGMDSRLEIERKRGRERVPDVSVHEVGIYAAK